MQTKFELSVTQKRALHWALQNEKIIGGGAIALPPGMGKTMIALMLSTERPSKTPEQKELYIVPPTLATQWHVETIKLSHLRAVVYVKNDAERLQEHLRDNDVDVLIISYYTLLHAPKDSQLYTTRWHRIIADEAHQIKNPNTAISKCMQTLIATYRWVMSGTFMLNGTIDLFGICKFLRCDGHRSKEHFELALKRRLVDKIMLQSSDEDRAALNLPPLLHKDVSVNMSSSEKQEYRRITVHHRQVAIKERKTTVMLKLITDLRIAVCSMESKIQQIVSIIRTALMTDATAKVLLFSNYIDVIDTYEMALRAVGIKCLLYTGKIDQKERDQRVVRFKAGSSYRVLILGFKCGNAGINLQCAQHVILDSPNWHNAINDQAIARAHRKGQTQPVTVYRIHTKNTIEDRIAEIARKKALAISRALKSRNPTDATAIMKTTLTKHDMEDLLHL